MMTTVAGLSILTYLRAHMTATIPNDNALDPEEGAVINNLWTIQELRKDLRRIKIAYNKAESVAELLSGKRLAASVRKA